LRLQPGDNDNDFVLVGGEDHKSGEADDADRRFQRLERWARGKIPMLRDVTHCWSGQVLDTIDYAGFIGKNPGSKYIYVATGRRQGTRLHFARCATGPDAGAPA
jgi:glycine/D-amino acid oxidase-like deaminating enzyme